jgi:hypothetical protein
LDFPEMQLTQLLVSSFNASDPYLPAVHDCSEQELASVNVTNGLDMKEPAGQQP